MKNLENAKPRTIRRRVRKCRTGRRDWVNAHPCATSSEKIFADFPAGSHLRDRQNLETLRFPTFLGPSVPCVAVGELLEPEVVEFWILRNLLCLRLSYNYCWSLPSESPRIFSQFSSPTDRRPFKEPQRANPNNHQESTARVSVATALKPSRK